MKKLLIPAVVLSFSLTACTRAHNKTGGATRDSSASHGNGGPADTSGAIGSGSPGQSGSSPGSSDTTSLGAPVTQPVTDSAKKKNP